MTDRRSSSIGCSEIEDYLQSVESGEMVACNRVVALCEYVRRVFDSETLTVNTEQLASYISLAKWFPFGEDGLFPWERFVLACVCTYTAGGLPRWPDIVCFIGRGNGKDGFIAFLSFCLSSRVHGIDKYDVDICANTEEQARRPFDDAFDVLDADYRWIKSWKWTKTYIKNRATGSSIRYRANNPRSRDGMRSGFCIFNEVHEYTDWRNITVFTTGMGKVPHPRRAFISSNGNVRDGVFDSMLERADRVLFEGADDGGYLYFICTLDNADEVDDETLWVKANPSLPWMPVLLTEIRKEYAEWKECPAQSPDFMTKRMGLPQGEIESQVTSWDNLVAASREPSFDLDGASCVCGIDFARTSDFVGCGLLFRNGDERYWLNHSWWCANSNDAGRVKAPLEEWAAAGIIEIVDEPEIHPSRITDWIYEQMGKYYIEGVAIDDYRYTLLSRELESIGFSMEDKTIKKVRPSDHMRVSPVINQAFRNGTLAWGDDPAMRWFTNNTKLVVMKNQNGNYKYDKIEPRSRKTDGFMAMVAAFCIEDSIQDEACGIEQDVILF